MHEKEAARAAVREFLTTRRARVTPADADAIRLLASWNADNQRDQSPAP
jgi:hypothetical protein